MTRASLTNIRRLTLVAVGCQLLLAGYLQVVEWIDLFPWNNVANGNAQETLDVVLPCAQAAFAVCYARQYIWPMVVGWAGYAAWLWLQLVSWWQPYLFGGRSVGPNWFFAKTYKFLPAIGDRPTPDACHVVLQLLLIAVLASAAIAIWQTWRERRSTAL